MSFRNLPPVSENVPARDKASQTLLSRQAVCPRSAYLYLKHDGGVASHAMHRGSAMHAFHQRLIETLVDTDEPSMPWELGKDIMAAVVEEHPEWVIPPDEMDVLRIAAFHICEYTVIDPSSVVAVEKLFELEVGGMRVRGKVDVAYALPDGGVSIWDLKSQAFVPTVEEFEAKPQIPLYALLVGEGHPVREEPCGACGGRGRIFRDPTGRQVFEANKGAVNGESGPIVPLPCEPCDGKGVIEVPEPPLGQRFGSFHLSEVYPRLEPWEEGTAKVLAHRDKTLTRRELVDQRLYVEGLVEKLKHGLETGLWPALPGAHCSSCAAPRECPLPAHLRDHAGTVTDLGSAQAALEGIVLEQADLKARLADVREFAKAHDVAVPFGDEEYGFEVVESEEWVTGKKIGRPDTAAAKQAMLDAIDRAVRTGEEFRYEDFRRARRSSTFKKRKKASEEASGAANGVPLPPRAPAPPEPPGDRQARLDEQYGETAPW